LDVVVVDVVGDCGRWFFIVRSRSVGDIWVGGVVALYVRPGHCDVGVPARLWRSSADSSPGYGRDLIWAYILVFFICVYIWFSLEHVQRLWSCWINTELLQLDWFTVDVFPYGGLWTFNSRYYPAIDNG
jgi:hypothetical protein